MINTSLYVALSGQVAGERRLATIADNVANLNTVGFRETGIRFSEQIGNSAKSPASYVVSSAGAISEGQGELSSTGNQLDFAINGSGWFLLQTAGGEAISRDGRFEIDSDGNLVNLEGYQVLDQGGAPVQVNMALGPVRTDASGILYQNNAIIGSIGVFDAAQSDETSRSGPLAILPEGLPTPATDRDDFAIMQGFVEKSNVNAIEQITRLITVQRNFEGMANAIEQSESTLRNAIQFLGGK